MWGEMLLVQLIICNSTYPPHNQCWLPWTWWSEDICKTLVLPWRLRLPPASAGAAIGLELGVLHEGFNPDSRISKGEGVGALGGLCTGQGWSNWATSGKRGDSISKSEWFFNLWLSGKLFQRLNRMFLFLLRTFFVQTAMFFHVVMWSLLLWLGQATSVWAWLLMSLSSWSRMAMECLGQVKGILLRKHGVYICPASEWLLKELCVATFCMKARNKYSHPLLCRIWKWVTTKYQSGGLKLGYSQMDGPTVADSRFNHHFNRSESRQLLCSL